MMRKKKTARKSNDDVCLIYIIYRSVQENNTTKQLVITQ